MTDAVMSSGFFNWLMQMLKSIAELRTPLMNGLMSVVTVLGQELAFIVLGVIILWCVDKKFGYRFLFMYMAGTVINQFLKAIFMIPRPWVIDPEFEIVESARSGASGWSFPSGHTQAAAVMYGGAAHRIGKKWPMAIACVLIALVGFSRMYLGVHTLLDVGAALVIGVAVIIFTNLLFNKIGDGLKPYAIATGIVALVSLGLIVFIMTVHKNDLDAGQVKDACVLFGTAFGLFAGSYVEKRFINFDTKARWWVQIIKAVAGVGLILALRVGLKAMLGLISASPLTDCVRYFIMSFFAIAVYPLFFKLFRKRETV